jgi:hypothetical protein
MYSCLRMSNITLFFQCYIKNHICDIGSQDNRVGIATRLLGGRPIVSARFPVGVTDISRLRNDKTGSGAHPASYEIGGGGVFPGGKAAKA